MRFRDRVAIVTAGSSGIGLACAQRLASEGASVLNADIRPPSAQAESRFHNLAGQWRWIEGDLGDRTAPERIVEYAVSLWGRDRYSGQQRGLRDRPVRRHAGCRSGTMGPAVFNHGFTGTFLMTKRCLPEMI